MAARGEHELAFAAIALGDPDLEQAAALEWFDIGGQRGAVDPQQIGHVCRAGGSGAVQRVQQGELTVRQVEGAERLVEVAGQDAGSALNMQAQTGIAHVRGRGEW